jgi:hypothetical protein
LREQRLLRDTLKPKRACRRFFEVPEVSSRPRNSPGPSCGH